MRRKEGVNISESPGDFKRPEVPPKGPPVLLDCRCGVPADEVLDGSMFGCSKCYFVNDSNRLVRTDDTGTYTPTEHWREVSLTEWEEFRKQTKGKRK